ncbi:MAG: hypothetical protein GY820_45000, partial [Gammaproteobacteria bacterium]|nr:hypothetical protein [Gammaproteobacteria bacterium]
GLGGGLPESVVVKEGPGEAAEEEEAALVQSIRTTGAAPIGQDHSESAQEEEGCSEPRETAGQGSAVHGEG